MRKSHDGNNGLKSELPLVSKKNWFVTLFLVLMATSAFGELHFPSEYNIYR